MTSAPGLESHQLVGVDERLIVGVVLAVGRRLPGPEVGPDLLDAEILFFCLIIFLFL